jgi:hypothetical protein
MPILQPLQEGVLANQTIHDKGAEKSVKSSIENLKKRYIPGPFSNLLAKLGFKGSENILNLYATFGKKSFEETVLFLTGKALQLLFIKQLNQDEFRVINANFKNLYSLKQGRKEKATANYLLKLAIFALEDKLTAAKIYKHSSEQLLNDMNERWASWFRNAIVDSQLAYRRDRGDMTWPSKSELNTDRSCFGGSLLRIITALNLMHPDVTVSEGQGVLLHNMQTYKTLHEQKVSIIKNFGQNYLVDVAKKYLEKVSIENLTDILGHLENAGLLLQDDTLDSFQTNLKTFIINNAQEFIEDKYNANISQKISNDLIDKHLSSFIEAYIQYNLQDHINEIIETKAKEAIENIPLPSEIGNKNNFNESRDRQHGRWYN